VGLLNPLLDRRDLLTVDKRGTGLSEPIDCPLLQSEPNPKLAGVTGCGDLLGHAADLYGTGLAADDLVAVLDALGYPVMKWSTGANANGYLNWFEIHGVKFTNEVAISGLARRDYLYPGQMRENLIVERSEGEKRHLEMTWQDRQPLATVKGTIGGRAIMPEMRAP
jgi:hypothetical protein